MIITVYELYLNLIIYLKMGVWITGNYYLLMYSTLVILTFYFEYFKVFEF